MPDCAAEPHERHCLLCHMPFKGASAHCAHLKGDIHNLRLVLAMAWCGANYIELAPALELDPDLSQRLKQVPTVRREVTSAPIDGTAFKEEQLFLPKWIRGKAVLFQESAGQWRAFNVFLQSDETALAYRLSKQLRDVHKLAAVKWGGVVKGRDEDGWVRTRRVTVVINPAQEHLIRRGALDSAHDCKFQYKQRECMTLEDRQYMRPTDVLVREHQCFEKLRRVSEQDSRDPRREGGLLRRELHLLRFAQKIPRRSAVIGCRLYKRSDGSGTQA